uniref:Retrotransposon protein putative n=1 Tax=Albugo laibachii Nc14 TaxID=890382 RepID=F0W6X7_9STRA|nr:retrotransposon protein putative [Albugo laibachii Nc14]|eukprot:CCA16872.1 retrotransposon protein putative [Albugo laibachii Nc14]
MKHPEMKCKLQRALYGTKQAARQWNNKINTHLESLGFNRSIADPCVYMRNKDSEYSIIVIYVDDLMIITETKHKINEIKRDLSDTFSIKELGIVWLRRFLLDLKYQVDVPTTIFQENQGTIALAKNPVYHSRTKHIDIRFHFIREKVEAKELEIEYKPTEEMVANALTKALPKGKYEDFIQALGMKNE